MHLLKGTDDENNVTMRIENANTFPHIFSYLFRDGCGLRTHVRYYLYLLSRQTKMTRSTTENFPLSGSV